MTNCFLEIQAEIFVPIEYINKRGKKKKACERKKTKTQAMNKQSTKKRLKRQNTQSYVF